MVPRRLNLLILLLFSLLATQFVLADDSANLENQAKDIYYSILSPFCPGRSLKDCPSLGADKLKKEILLHLEAGETPEDVYNEIYSKYGEDLRAVPKNEGFGRTVWLGPIAFLLVGVFVIVLRVVSARKK